MNLARLFRKASAAKHNILQLSEHERKELMPCKFSDTVCKPPKFLNTGRTEYMVQAVWFCKESSSVLRTNQPSKSCDPFRAPRESGYRSYKELMGTLLWGTFGLLATNVYMHPQQRLPGVQVV